MTRGRFISFEGGEGTGKTTQIARMARAIEARGYDVVSVREPGGTPLGEEARHWLLAPERGPLAPETELMLFAAARAQLVAEVIKPALADGRWVLADRFADSTTVYQAHARGLQRKLVDAVNTLAVQGCLPDRTLVLDVPPDVGLARAHAQQEFDVPGGDRIEREALAFHEAVRDGYHALVAAEPTRLRLIDATGDADAVHAACMDAIRDWIAAA